eukprot:5566711-Pyramimonas_sp.AAC.1
MHSQNVAYKSLSAFAGQRVVDVGRRGVAHEASAAAWRERDHACRAQCIGPASLLELVGGAADVL